jgi:Fur family peroxide stress response transcriptional regulator
MMIAMHDADYIKDRIKAAGLRPTQARVRILACLEARKDHPTAEELLLRLNESGDAVGRATVYQNIEKLTRAGIVRSLSTEEGTRRYDSALTEHQHFVCARTGRVLDVHVDPQLLKQLRPLDPNTGEPLEGASIGGIRIEFHGSTED